MSWESIYLSVSSHDELGNILLFQYSENSLSIYQEKSVSYTIQKYQIG